MLLGSEFDEEFSIRVGKRGRYINTTTDYPPEGAAILSWWEMDVKRERTGLQGMILDNCCVSLSGSYLRKRVREDYDKQIELMKKHRGRHTYSVKLPDGSIA